MTKIAYSKLKHKVEVPVAKIPLDKEGTFILEVKEYLPIQERLQLLTDVLNQSADPNRRFYNPGLLGMFLELEMIKYYTNLTFTDKQLENPTDLYDKLKSNGVIDKVIDHNHEVYDALYSDLMRSAKSIYDYQNSAYGILDAVSTDYDNLNLDVEELQKKLSDSKDIKELGEIVSKMN